MLRTLALLSPTAVLLSACGLLLDDAPAAVGSPDGGMDGGEVDAAVLDATQPDVPLLPDDSGPAVTDGGVADAIAPPAPIGCPALPTLAGPIAHYTFERDDPMDSMFDETEAHHGEVPFGLHCTAGPCETAICFAGGASDPPVGYIPPDGAFMLAEGAVEFVASIDRTGAFGLVSRDASGSAWGGHLSIFTSDDNHVIARIQRAGESGDEATWLCSAAQVTPGRWFHVGVSWGGAAGFQLYLDGDPALVVGERLSAGGEAGVGAVTFNCDPPGAADVNIRGNDEPWYLGVYSGFRPSGAEGGLRMPLDGALDELRIYRTDVDFGRL